MLSIKTNKIKKQKQISIGEKIIASNNFCFIQHNLDQLKVFSVTVDDQQVDKRKGRVVRLNAQTLESSYFIKAASVIVRFKRGNCLLFAQCRNKQLEIETIEFLIPLAAWTENDNCRCIS